LIRECQGDILLFMPGGAGYHAGGGRRRVEKSSLTGIDSLEGRTAEGRESSGLDRWSSTWKGS